MEWSTESQQNDDYFNIERSADGRTWTSINKVYSKNSSSNVNNYITYDNNPPPNNTIYYRLQLYDKDGTFATSDVKSVSMAATNKAVVSVIPNPATSTVNFKIESTTTQNVQSLLTDVSGRIIHAQLFENVEPGSINKVNLQHLPPPGIYVLKLKGDGFSETVKVVMQ